MFPKYSIDKCCQLLGTNFAMISEPKARSSYFSQIYILFFLPRNFYHWEGMEQVFRKGLGMN